MSGFKNTTRMIQGHHNWDGRGVQTPPKNPTTSAGSGGTINRLARGGPVDDIHTNPGHPEVYPKEGDRMHGNALTLRKESPTQELEEHGGKSPLVSKFKKGGPARHFHVHHHHHAKGGKITTSTKTYRGHEKQAEAFAEGGSVHDNTNVPAGGPDYKRGGTTRPIRKNAGGATYAPGGAVIAPPAMGGAAPMGSALGQLAARPRGLPMRPALPMRRPMAMPGPQPAMRARGGSIGARTVAKQEVAKHVRTAPPRGHGVR